MRASADTQKLIRSFLLLLFLIAGGFAFRTVFAESVMIPPLRMQGETTQAYRYTAMISDGRGVPSLDTLVLRPQGFHTGENSIFEEYIAGGIHRFTGGDLTAFLTVFCRLFPLLALPVIFLWMSGAGFSLPESSAGAAFYAVFLPAMLRTRGESLYRETVALPLILLSLALLDNSIRRTGKEILKYSIPAALALFLALGAWKVTGFVSFFIFVWLAFTKPGYRVVIPMAVAQLAAAVLFSHMRHDGALFSPATIMAAGAVASSFINSVSIRWTALIASVATGFLTGTSSSGHVTSVIIAKLKFFFSHPEDPTLLNTDARLFWVSGYTSPSPGQIILLFGLAFIIAVLGWKSFREKARGTAMLFFLPLSLAGYLFFDRLHVFLAVAVIPPVIAASRGKKWILPLLLTVFGFQAMFAPQLAEALASVGLPPGNSSSLLGDSELDDLLDWYSDNKHTTLSFWHLSGLLSAYSETPVVTHTFFENEENRNTIINFASCIYGSEQAMVDLMESREAVYLLYQADFIFDRTPQGLIYLAGLSDIPEGALAVRLHYYPESLERLQPVWQGPSIRVFELDGISTDLQRWPLWEARYGSFIHESSLASSSVNAPVQTGIYLAEDGIASQNPQKISAALLLFSHNNLEVPADAAISLLQQLLVSYLDNSYEIEFLEQDFIAYLRAWGPDPQLRFDLVRLLRDSGFDQRADHHMDIIERLGRNGI